MASRNIKYFIFIIAFGCLLAWLALNPGTLSISWLGYEIQTSVTFLFFVVFLVLLLSHILGSGWHGIVWFFKEILSIGSYLKKDPNKILAEAFSAIEFGNYKEAQKLAKQAMNLMPESALPGIALLKSSQKAEDKRAQNVALAHLKKFDSWAPMAFYDEVETALKTKDLDGAKKVLKQMEKEYQHEGWFIKQSLKTSIAAKKWQQALSHLDALVKVGGMVKKDAHQIYAYVWHNLSKAPKLSDAERLAMMEKSYEYGPLFLDNLIDLAKALTQRKDKRAAQTLLEKAWNDMPAWGISEAYCELMSENTPLKRAQKARKLYDIRPDHPVSQLILIRYFIDAKLWGEAKRVLHLIPRDVPEAYVLRAALAKKEKNDIEKVIDHLKSAVQKISYPYKCTNCRKSCDSWDVFCKHCGSFLHIYLKHPVTYANCADALE